MTKREEADVQDTEAGIHGGVQGKAVKRVRAGQGLGPVARELGLVEQTLRNWVKAAERS